MANEPNCPLHTRSHAAAANHRWWPNQLNLAILHQHSPRANPMVEARWPTASGTISKPACRKRRSPRC